MVIQTTLICHLTAILTKESRSFSIGVMCGGERDRNDASLTDQRVRNENKNDPEKRTPSEVWQSSENRYLVRLQTKLIIENPTRMTSFPFKQWY